MAKISEFEKHALKAIAVLELKRKEVIDIRMRCEAEIEAYKQSIEWYKNTRTKRVSKTK